jgi:YcaO-like protein with predicted kinase domain
MSASDGPVAARPELAASKGYRAGCHRMISPASTLDRMRPLMRELGITRIANITGLDRIGIPTVAVYRPNARSLSVAQGKGATLIEAQVSGLMESIELHHAEHVTQPLLLGSHRELRDNHPIADVTGLPQTATCAFDPAAPMLWSTGVDLPTGKATLVSFELVHTDFRSPLPTGSGAFLVSSNGLASGNHLNEAISHAICELVERDANTLFHFAGMPEQERRRVDPHTVDDATALEILDRFEAAGIDVGIWETTSDVGIASFLCTVVDRDQHIPRPMPPVSGSGCHPSRRVALLRSLTEAAQGRLTLIAGARDDLSRRQFDDDSARSRAAEKRAQLRSERPRRSFAAAPDVDHDTFDADVHWELQQLAAAGLRQVIAVNLSSPRLQVPVVRVIIPHLEAMSEVPGYVPGARARRQTEANA